MPAMPSTMTQLNYDLIVSRKWPAFNENYMKEYFKMPTSGTVQKMFSSCICWNRALSVSRPIRERAWTNPSSWWHLWYNIKDNGNTWCRVQLTILGEYGHIISFACCEGERNLVKERLLFFLWLQNAAKQPKYRSLYSFVALWALINEDSEYPWLKSIIVSCDLNRILAAKLQAF